MACEKCWRDASFRSMNNGRSVAENYEDLMDERKDNPCTPEEEAGPVPRTPGADRQEGEHGN